MLDSAFKAGVVDTHQAVNESHAEAIGSLVQFHYKHHTQVIRKGRGARGGHRERKLTATNTPCRGQKHPNAQNTHTQRVSLWGWMNTVGRHMQQSS